MDFYDDVDEYFSREYYVDDADEFELLNSAETFNEDMFVEPTDDIIF